MEEKIVYRPYSYERFESVVVFLFALYGAYSVLTATEMQWRILGGILVLCMLALAKYFFDLSCRVFCFEREGVRVLERGGRERCFIHWDAIAYAYYLKTIRGGMNLVLSSQPMEAEAVRGLFLWGGGDGLWRDVIRLSFDENQTEENARIRNLISDKVPNISVIDQ